MIAMENVWKILEIRLEKQTGLYIVIIMKATTKKSDARQRLIETAERLFYADGIHSVGIDRIIAEAGVAKMTLYNHFQSKDELIVAVLEYREQQVEAMFDNSIRQHVSTGMNQLDAFFATLEAWFATAGFRGCSFINASVELARVTHPGFQFASQHKENFHEMIHQCVKEEAGRNANQLTPAISLLVEGAIVVSVLQQSAEPARIAHKAARALISQKMNSRT